MPNSRAPDTDPAGLIRVGHTSVAGHESYARLTVPLKPGTTLYDSSGHPIGAASPVREQRGQLDSDLPAGWNVYVKADEPHGETKPTTASTLAPDAIGQLLHTRTPDGHAFYTLLNTPDWPSAIATLRLILEAYERLLNRPRLTSATERLHNRLKDAVEGVDNNVLLAGDLRGLLVECRDAVALELLDNNDPDGAEACRVWMRRQAEALGYTLAPTAGPLDLARFLAGRIQQWVARDNAENLLAQPATTDAGLVEQIDALVALDDARALVPHGIGGLAKQLLLACRERITRDSSQ